MSSIVLDKAAANALLSCRETTVLRGPEGAVIGVFEPGVVTAYEPGVVPEFDESELDRREQRWAGIPADEVRRRLEQLR